MEFITELEQLINRHSKDKDCNTPDYVLSVYLNGCLENFKTVVNARDEWGKPPINEKVNEVLKK